MTSPNAETVHEDLVAARLWLKTAGKLFDNDSVESAHAAAVIGNAYVNLAHATRALDAMNESAKVTARQLVAFDAIAEAAADAEVPTLGALAEARRHDDEPNTGFLGLTRHGHPIGSRTIPDDIPQPTVARCGGPALCSECGRDAAVLREVADRG